jgi:5-methylcytosine-specific restriction endonuclease McrA
MRPDPQRTEAKLLGLPTYNSGKPCKSGHVCDRYTSTKSCIECLRAWPVPDEQKARKAARRKLKREAANGYSRDRDRATREIAAKAGLSIYESEVPCARGHERFRAVSDGKCVACKARVLSNWRRRNPGRFGLKEKVYVENRRARKLAGGGSFTQADILAILTSQKGRCAYCKVDIRRRYHMDHIIALSRGGSSWPRNIQLLCRPCNQRKHAKDPIRFAREIGLLV